MFPRKRIRTFPPALVVAASMTAAAHAAPTTYDDITFPQGDISFADAVVSYEPDFDGGNVPTNPANTDPAAAIGPPGPSTPDSNRSISLGSGGRITLQFIDNALTGSGDGDDLGDGDGIDDLHVFEIGPLVEDTFVEISKDNETYFDVGKVLGATSSIDIDAYGFGAQDEFFYVRLRDDPDENATTGSTVGADIDAVGAISTTPARVIPTPAAASMGIALLAGLIMRRGRTRRHA